MTRRKNLATLAAVTAGVIALTAPACSSGDPKPEGSASTQDSTTAVTYLTSFNTFGRDAYAYVAQEKGYFAEAGLDVTIQPGTGSVDVMKLVASGSADFGTADFSTVVVTVANEKLPITAVGAIHQRTLAAILSIDGYGIETPADLEGKSIGDQPGSTNQIIFPTYAEAAGVDASTVTFVPAAPPALPQLLGSHQVDGIGQFVVGKSLIEAVSNGKDVVVLPYGDLLPDLYGNALITSDTLLDKDPELVKAFSGALMKGLAYSIENPEETGEILRKYQPTQDADVAAAEVTAMAPYVAVDGTTIGSMDPDRVTKVVEILSEALTGEVDPQTLVAFDLVP